MKTMRYNKNQFIFPCGIKINITQEKLEWIFKLFKLVGEFDKLIKFGVVDIPIGSARQIKDYLEKD